MSSYELNVHREWQYTFCYVIAPAGDPNDFKKYHYHNELVVVSSSQKGTNVMEALATGVYYLLGWAVLSAGLTFIIAAAFFGYPSNEEGKKQ